MENQTLGMLTKMKEIIEQINDQLGQMAKAIQEMKSEMVEGFQQVNNRLDKIESKMDGLGRMMK